MADVRRSRVDAGLGRCRKHPWHHQSPGVCSLCLGERLSRLSSSSGKKPSSSWRLLVVRSAVSSSSSSPSSVSTYYSSSSESSYCHSPSRRLADVAKSGPLLFSAFFGGGKEKEGKNNLKKSRSTATETVRKVPGDVAKDEKAGKKTKKKWTRVWSKLVNRRKKRRDGDDNGLKRSGTVREKVTT